MLCLVFHPGSQTLYSTDPPLKPIKWRIVKETFLECLTHYSLPTDPPPSPLRLDSCKPTSWVRNMTAAVRASYYQSLHYTNRRSPTAASLTGFLIARRASDLQLPASRRPFICSPNVRRFATTRKIKKGRKQAKLLKIYKLISV